MKVRLTNPTLAPPGVLFHYLFGAVVLGKLIRAISIRIIQNLEQFSIECRKIETKLISTTNHNTRRHHH